MTFALIVAGSFFALVSVYMIMSKGQDIIVGISVIDTDKTDKLDKIKLSRFMAIVIFCLALSMFIGAIGSYLAITWLISVCLVLFVTVVIFALVILKKSDRFYVDSTSENNDNPDLHN